MHFKWHSVFLTLILFITLGPAAAQTKVDTFRYPSGVIRSYGGFNNGARHGVWHEFNKTGDLTSIITYEDGKRNGPFEMWVSHEKQGVSATAKDGMHHKGAYSMDRPEGPYFIWFPDGQQFIECYYKKGVKDSVWRSWHPGGELKISQFYKRGVLDGDYEENLDDGRPKETRIYQAGRLVTATKYEYYANKKLKSESRYFYEPISGREMNDGISKDYYEDGKLHQVRSYTKGKLDGTWEGYHSNGKLKYKATYKLGKLELWEDFDEKGKPIRE